MGELFSLLGSLGPPPAQGSWPPFPAVSAVGCAPGWWISAQSLTGAGYPLSWGLMAALDPGNMWLVPVAIAPGRELLEQQLWLYLCLLKQQ